MDTAVPVSAQHLQEIVARIADRRLAVEKELMSLGQPSKGINDIFRHCRGFERAFQTMLNEANVSFKVRAVVEGNLPETLRRIPIEKRFNKNYVREICREADGYQPHLVSPERGIRRLVAEAMKLTNEHVHRFVDEIHLVLLETVRDAARRSVIEETGVSQSTSVVSKPNSQSLDFLRLKGFENAVIVAAQQALEQWRSEAHKVAEIMVQMECDYVTPSFFRDLERRFHEEQGFYGEENDVPTSRLDQLAQGQISEDTEGGEDSDNESITTADGPAVTPRSPTPGSGGTKQQQQQQQAAQQPQRDDLKVGWLEKRAGDSSSLNALPVESWRWQRRWFVLAMDAGFLYYFGSPDEMSNPGKSPKVTVNLRECLVEDFQPEAQGIPTRKSTQKLDNNAGSVSLLLRIMHKNPNLPVSKNHHQMILRASDASDKYDWLARLRAATEPAAGQGKAAGRPQGTSSQYLAGGSGKDGSGALASSASDKEKSGLLTRTAAKFARFTGLGGNKLADEMAMGSFEDLEQYYERLGHFCGLYARNVYDRMAKTIPKAIILCQVIRSRDKLLDQLYNYISSLKPVEIEFLLQEDPAAEKRRTAAQQASKDLTEAQNEVQRLQEHRATIAAEGKAKAESEPVSVRALLLAGAFPLVPKDKVPQGINAAALYGEYTPVTLAAGVEARYIQFAPPLGDSGKGGSSSGGVDSSEKKIVPAENGSAAVAAVAAKPRRMPPPPPPK